MSEQDWDNRYFIVFFEGTYDEGIFKGVQGFESDRYINLSKATEVIEEEHGLDEVVPTNIVEVTFEDYITFLL